MLGVFTVQCIDNSFCVILSEIVPKPTFSAKNKKHHPILNPCAKFELNWLRNTKVTEKPHFRWLDLVLKLEMKSFSDNAYRVTNFIVLLKSSWPMLYSYQVSLLSVTK